MKIAIVVGSHRREAESARVARYLEQELKKLGISETYLLSLSGNPLPLWDEDVWSGDEKWKSLWGPISKELKSSDGLVVVAPEWSGMVPPGLKKNSFLLCSADVLVHKPGLIVTVSAGAGGSYPVTELRISSYRNTRLCYVPDHVIVRNVGQMLHGDHPPTSTTPPCADGSSTRSRVLIEYAKALRLVRASGVIDLKAFPYGM